MQNKAASVTANKVGNMDESSSAFLSKWLIPSSLHSPTDPSQSDADCAESDGVHKDFVESKRTLHDVGCLCGLHTKIALSKD